MKTVTINNLTQQIKQLPYDKLVVVYDFVSFILEKNLNPVEIKSEAFQTMAASEMVLGKDWESAEEEQAWANL
ncbi:MAG: DUF2281 domain-containing protein [Desulfobacterales bacterium]|nr:DUF2281 domain-containing protein [Desulfobacterales bacterium]MBF0395564.1 DUF2281 domain-containing protein [Desulfobacterales bacterium]